MRVERATAAAAVIVATAILAGCAGPATVGPVYRRAGTWSEMVYATAHGPMLVEVHGNPFPKTSPADLAKAVAVSMTGNVFSRPTAFTADAKAAPHPHLRVVMAFNPPKGTDDNDLCRGRIGRSDTVASGTIRVEAAFCDHDLPLSALFGWTEAAGPDDPRFGRLVADVTLRLFGTGVRNQNSQSSSGALQM